MALLSLKLRETLGHDDLVFLCHGAGDDLLEPVDQGLTKRGLLVLTHLVHQVANHTVALHRLVRLVVFQLQSFFLTLLLPWRQLFRLNSFIGWSRRTGLL